MDSRGLAVGYLLLYPYPPPGTAICLPASVCGLVGPAMQAGCPVCGRRESPAKPLFKAGIKLAPFLVTTEICHFNGVVMLFGGLKGVAVLPGLLLAGVALADAYLTIPM